MSHSISFTASRAGAQGQRRGHQSHPGQGQGSSTALPRGHTPQWAPRQGVLRAQRALPALGSLQGSQKALLAWSQLSREASSGQSHVVLPRATHVMARQHPGHGEVALEEVTWLGSAAGGANGLCRVSSALGAEQGVLRAQS